ncbi:HAD domain-containing protein [Paenibacillus sp. NAIST15-1]|uniref:HAD domain-containing protein n=1 Tax=Paenibacillus sp. NAIST15-1 TaxID=1605994 RepID=UPI00086A9D01|nr:HAD domain-containing protein [Paenibacillus sp. NAIST15-1]GAV11738.1 hypothetical protein PBN151_1667 [Paenibacillus sp. NAIST15-1]
MKIIFLDIDGVINTDRAIMIQRNHNSEEFVFDQKAMKHLKEIVTETNAYFVISSTWRVHYGTSNLLWNSLIRNLNQYGLEERIIGITPILDQDLRTSNRWKEIQNWLTENQNKEIESFVILDDEWDMGIYTMNEFVKCQGYIGINEEVKEKAIKILNTCDIKSKEEPYI